MLERFSAAKKLNPVKSVSKMAVVRKRKGLNIKYSNRDPPEWTSLPGTTASDAFCVQICLGV